MRCATCATTIYRELQRALEQDYPRWQQLQLREQGYTDASARGRHNAEAALTPIATA
jgi:hypothetical protein